MEPIIIIPCYRHGEVLRKNLKDLEGYGIPVLIVDDGNTEPLEELLSSLKLASTTIIRRSGNGGKGQAVADGMTWALQQGYTHGLQIDADNQLDHRQIPAMINLAQQHPEDLIAALPRYHNIPLGRYLGRYLTHLWVSIEMGNCHLVDSMCGMRVYPLDPACEILGKHRVGHHMGFDTEIMVRLYWSGCDIITHPVEVTYYPDGISNFRPFWDNLDLSLSHTRLCIEKILHFGAIHRRKYR